MTQVVLGTGHGQIHVYIFDEMQNTSQAKVQFHYSCCVSLFLPLKNKKTYKLNTFKALGCVCGVCVYLIYEERSHVMQNVFCFLGIICLYPFSQLELHK